LKTLAVRIQRHNTMRSRSRSGSSAIPRSHACTIPGWLHTPQHARHRADARRWRRLWRHDLAGPQD
jgi:hypothetical protein